MSSNLISIGRSGVNAARSALEVTSNNMTNASSVGYVRRSASMSEVAMGSVSSAPTAVNLGGVRINGIIRNVDQFRQSEVRRTGSDLARAGAELDGLGNIESALETTGVFDSIVDFEASLQQLVSDPTNGALRASVVEKARTMGETFNLAANSLDAVGQGLTFEAGAGVDQVNGIAAELAQVNARLARAADGTTDQNSLLDKRDALLEQLSGQVGITTTFNPDKTVTVLVGGPSGAPLVTGSTAGTMSMTPAGDGTLDFAVDGTAVTLNAGALAGKNQALAELTNAHDQLDAIAAGVINTVNTAQANGVDLAGNPGQPLFSGSTAGDMKMIASGGDALATAPAGAGANSRDATNLVALRGALATQDPAGSMDKLLFGVSSAVAGRQTTYDTLDTIAGGARTALLAQSGVDLDEEAVNLVRFQQAYEASGKIIQVANDIFDSILSIR